MTRAIAAIVSLAVAGVVVVAVRPDGAHPRTVKVALTNANGLRDGSAVVRGGTEIGKLHLRLDRNDRLLAEIRLADDAAPIARNSKLAITAVNLLGRKRLEVISGNPHDPAPDGATLPASSVSTSTDLDQVLAVLDRGTRSRLQILLGEAGRAVVGRRMDISELLEELPQTLPESARLFDALAADNRQLASLVEHSDRLLAAVVPERRALTRLVHGFASAATSVAHQGAAVRASLARAPATLAATRRFLAELQATTRPLGPAARRIAAASAPLDRTLRALGPVRETASPALRTATAVAPQLTELARAAAPVLRRGGPVAGRLTQFAANLRPVSATLNHSIDDVLAVVDNWTRAVQLRDGLSHVFRGQASVTAETLRSMLERLTPPKQERRANRRRRPDQPRRESPEPAVAPQARPAPITPPTVGQILQPVQDLLDGIAGRPTRKPDGSASDGVGNLLDYLLEP